MTLETIKAYAAGIIDGEGCITIRRKRNPENSRNYYNLVVKVGMTGNSSAIDILKTNWGGQICLSGKLRRQKQWSIYCLQAEKFLRDVLPYLIVKKNQAEVALDFHKNRKRSSELYGEQVMTILSSLKVQSYT